MTDRRLDALRRLLAEAHRRLDTSMGFRLWDGSTVPAGHPETALTLAFADEGTIASLVRRPKLDTLIQLLAEGRVELANGSLFDFAAARPKGKIGRVLKDLPKALVAEVGLRFLFAPTGAPPALATVQGGTVAGTPETNKANIAYHYDVGNAFYRLFLDADMVYSCGYFAEDHDDIDRAQADKLDMICRKLRLKPGDRFLDVGCGWGALVCHAATHYGVSATGITLSEEQLAGALEKVVARGLVEKVTLKLTDYTRLEGTFDKVASIGMFEHVGIANHPSYFQAVNRLLVPGGLYLHHCISRPAKATEKKFARGSAEYRALTRYIFPGGELDHLGMSIANLERHGFEVHDVEGWREHYRRTCKLWHDRLLARRAEAVEIVGERTVRMWLVYLAGCSLGFENGGALINQTLASKRRKGVSPVPLSRGDLFTAR